MQRETKGQPNWGRYVLRPTLFDIHSELEFYKILRDEILGQKFVALVQVPIARIVDMKDKHRGRFEATVLALIRRLLIFWFAIKKIYNHA